ncbi:MAG: four helix bundle protein [Bacteroidetes bacterium]|nr:four helix bundle protein [Bacteroidota bacterium]PIX32478.1 MAG: four helix bundle protein [Bacteroidetes bacterium CG_4_8_14_3_um_filter_31_14]
MKGKSIIQEKSFLFAIKIVNIYKYLISEKKEYVLSKQLLKSGTSIGANVSEAVNGQSVKDFISKLSIARKEAQETLYWLNLLEAPLFLNKTDANKLILDY